MVNSLYRSFLEYIFFNHREEVGEKIEFSRHVLAERCLFSIHHFSGKLVMLVMTRLRAMALSQGAFSTSVGI